MAARWPLHILVYGDAGSKKSTFAATMPKPMLVFAFDAFGKERPYLRRGIVADPGPAGLGLDAFGTPYREVYSARKPDRLIIRIEHYLDADPEKPEAYMRFKKRMAAFHHEYDSWMTVVVDSVTFMEYAARMLDTYRTNPKAKDGRQHYGASKEAIEQMLLGRFSALPMNVVVICHVDEEKDEVHGMQLRNPAAPGKLSKRLPAGYSEMYHAFVTRGDRGERRYLLQTQADHLWNAATQIPAPDPCEPEYRALWAEVEAPPEAAP